MVWHILRKDLRLLRIGVLVVATIHLAGAALRSWLGLFPEPRQLVIVADLLSLLSLLGIVVLTVAVMHEDAVPGVRQDWLIRPINRIDLVFAKLLFVMLVVQGPLLLADLSQGLLDGLTFPDSLGAAAARNAAVLCFFSLPALMIGAVTRSQMESFAVAVVGLIIYVAVFLLGVVLLLGVRTSIGGSGLSWMFGATWYALALVGSAVVVWLQFFWRKTSIARCLIGAGGAAIILSSFVPWRAAFALQERLSKQPSSAAAIELAFNPLLGPFKLPAGSAAASGAGLYLPLRVTGIPVAAVVFMDRADLRISDVSGRTLYQGRTNLTVDGVGSIQDARLEVRQSEPGAAAADVHQRIFIPASIYAGLKDQSVRMEIDYSLTLLRAAAVFSLPASGGTVRLKGLGWCSTRIDDDGDEVQLRCLDTGRTPSCFSAFLQYMPGSIRNPEAHFCDPDYTPLATNLWPDALSRLGGEVPFFDRSGLTRYPVDGSKLADSRLVIKTYEPREHFMRHLNIPAIQLSRFAAVPGA
jgi:hypothetical protein